MKIGAQRMDNRVVVKRCEEYDAAAIERIVSEGMAQLGYDPRGKAFVKPNVVFSGDPKTYRCNAFTHPAFIGASLLAISKKQRVNRVELGENCAIGIPTRYCFKYAGYYDEVRRVKKDAPCPVEIFCMDEDPRDSVFIGGVVHDNLRVSRRMARADTKIYLPKLKCHGVSQVTGAVKLNIGICSDDERAIRHDFMLNEKIVDLLSVGWPDFIAMDAIEVGVGNEAFPTPRKLGLILMGTNPLAVDLVGARLLGYDLDDVPYLKRAVERGYAPAGLDQVVIEGDVSSLEGIDESAKRLLPYDDEFTRWQDVHKELKRLNSPIRFYWGPYRQNGQDKCLTGCVMGLKMWLAAYESFPGPDAFAKANPVVLVIGKVGEKIDANGQDVFLVGSCAQANITNAAKVIRIDKCFTTAVDMTFKLGGRLGMRSPIADPKRLMEHFWAMAAASLNKTVNGRYLQDVGYFITKRLDKRI
jgi:uncharacterized protein (DUF362 family)